MRRSAATVLVALSVAASACGGGGRNTPVPDIPDEVVGTITVPQLIGGSTCRLSAGTGRGVEVVLVEEDVPAAGVLQPGDVIIEADGVEVTETGELIAALAGKQAGDSIHLRAVRTGAGPIEVDVEFAVAADGSGPRMGIEIQTAVEMRDLQDVDAAASVDSPLAVVVSIQGQLYAVDASTGVWRSLELATPADVWMPTDGQIYVLEQGSPTRIANIGDPESGVDFTVEGWNMRAVIGSQAGRVLVLGNRESEGGVQAVIFAVDPETGDIAWEWSETIAVSFDAPVSVFALSSPSQERTLVGTVEFDEEGTPNFLPAVLLDLEGAGQPVQRPISWRARALGWFSDGELTYVDPTGDSVMLWDIDGGDVDEVAVPVPTDSAGYVPVGDGTNLFMVTSEGMNLIGPARSSRPLADDCLAEVISPPGYVVP